MYDIIALGCGLVGKFVVTKLSSLGYKIHVIDLVIPTDIKENSEISCEEGDVFQIVNDLPKAKVILNLLPGSVGETIRRILISEGNDLSIITYGMGVHWALQYAKDNSNLNIDILDLRTLIPLDIDSIYETVKKTGRVIVLHEDCMTGGIGGEIVALISENCFLANS